MNIKRPWDYVRHNHDQPMMISTIIDRDIEIIQIDLRLTKLKSKVNEKKLNKTN